MAKKVKELVDLSMITVEGFFNVLYDKKKKRFEFGIAWPTKEMAERHSKGAYGAVVHIRVPHDASWRKE